MQLLRRFKSIIRQLAYADFQATALRAAEALSLPLTRDVFSIEPAALEAEYFDRFDAICNEIKNADPRSAPSVGDIAR